jgi:hypothetical protein
LADGALELNGSLYGQALFPHLSAVEHAGLKFRNFLEAFPELVEVFRGPSGDMVRVLHSAQANRVEELAAKYREALANAMHELTESRKESTVPAVQLAKWLKKLVPDFNTKRIGFNSLFDWLERQNDLVEVSHREFGGRVRLLPSEPKPESPASKANIPTGYILVDSVDVLSTLHTILSVKPSSQQLPDWGALLRFLKERYPAVEWKGRYFMTFGRNPTEATDGFKAYLEAIGYKVIQLALESDPLPLEEVLLERATTNRSAVAKMIHALVGQNVHVFVVSHNDSIVLPLSKVLEKKPTQAVVGVIGFPERMAESVIRLKPSSLVVIDADKDAKLFKQTIPRRHLMTPEAFDPTQFL